MPTPRRSAKKPGPKRSVKKARERKLTQKARQIQITDRVERRGGARVNAGRPPGIRSVAKRLLSIREVTEDIIREGKVPLRVMIKNMNYYDEQAVYLQEQLEDAMVDNAKRFTEDGFIKCLELMNKMGDSRMKATQVASLAAPYLHPRLSAMEMNVNHGPKPKDIVPTEVTEKFSDDFRQLRSQPYIIEQEMVDVEPEPEPAQEGDEE